MAQSGYIYVLYNPSANGVVKIGKTQRSPDERAKELSSATGVPTPFIVVYQSNFQDCHRAELFIHTKLEKYRVSNNREFFQLPIHLAINTVLEAKKFLEKSKDIFDELGDSGDSDSSSSVGDDSLDSLTFDDEQDAGNEMLKAADMYFYGFDDTIQDYDEAFNLYQKAARLGSAEAFFQMGYMCQRGWGHPVDNRRALEFFKEGIKHGNDECWAEMAMIYYLDGHKSNEEKCWSKYFSSENFSSFNRRKVAMYNYVQFSIIKNRPIMYKEQIIQIRNEVLEFINDMVDWHKENGDDVEIQRKCFIAVKEL